jgi:hypothetical protein
VVQDIYEIIETYAEKCAVNSITVNENNKKLIIQSESTTNEESHVDEMEHENDHDEDEEFGASYEENPIFIKQESFDMPETLTFVSNPFDNVSYREDESINVVPSTSKTTNVKRVRKIEYSRDRNKRSKYDNMLKYGNFTPVDYDLPVQNRRELMSLAFKLDNDQEYEKSLGVSMLRSKKEMFDANNKHSHRAVIRSILKTIIHKTVLDRMNMTGNCKIIAEGQCIKAPAAILKFVTKCAKIITSLDDEFLSEEVRIIVRRWISDVLREKKDKNRKKVGTVEVKEEMFSEST